MPVNLYTGRYVNQLESVEFWFDVFESCGDCEKEFETSGFHRLQSFLPVAVFHVCLLSYPVIGPSVYAVFSIIESEGDTTVPLDLTGAPTALKIFVISFINPPVL